MAREYEAEDIEVLSDVEHVLKRPEMYVGSTNSEHRKMHLYDENGDIYIEEVEFVPALWKLIEEVLANSIDEHVKGTATKIDVTLSDDCRTIKIKDDGAGIPIQEHPDPDMDGQYTPEVVLTRLRSGSNFSDDERRTLGLYGVGVSLVTYLSDHLGVRIRRDKGTQYEQEFKNNASERTEPNIRSMKRKNTFTEIKFTPDFDRFDCDKINRNILKKYLIDFAYIFPEMSFSLKCGGNERKKFKESGIKNFMESLAKKNKAVEINSKNDISIGVTSVNNVRGRGINQISFVNGARTFRGGMHIDVLRDSIKKSVREEIRTNLDIKPRDIDSNIFIVAFLNVDNPKFEGQGKERLVNDESEIKEHVSKAITNKFCKKIANNKTIKNEIKDQARVRIDRIKKRKIRKKERKKTKKRTKKLVSCSTTNRDKASLYIVEGLSALSNGIYVRDPKTMAFLPLKGKPINAYKHGSKRILKNDTMCDLLNSLGLSLLDDSIEDCRYGNIYVTTDADEDGSHIESLLITFFYKYWPDLFEQGIIRSLRSPRFVVVNSKNDRKYYYTKDELNKAKQSNEIKRNEEVRYIKGLGGLDRKDWQYMLVDNPSFEKIIIDDETPTRMEMAFGKSSDGRKEWLSSNT